MKKFLVIVLTALVTVMLSLSVAAQDHIHTWEIVPTEPARVEIACTVCDQHVIVPTDNLLCDHNFESVVVDDYHGDKCVYCGYTVLNPHDLVDWGFVDGSHLLGCTGCDIEIYHSVTEWVDEAGYHTKCDVCGKVETTLSHTHETMNVRVWNELFHAWECWDCGYLECEPHDSAICSICQYCDHPNLVDSSTEDECSVECPDCGHAYTGDHQYYYDGNDTAVCEICGKEEGVTIQYGLLQERAKTEDGYLINLLVDGTTYQYKCWNTSINTGSLVRVKVAHDQVVSIGRRVETDIMNSDITELCDHLYSPLRNYYEEVTSWEEITVSSVAPFVSANEKEELCVEFKDGGVEFFNPEELVVYNLTTGSMDEVEENDVILYFSPREEGQKEIIIIIG